MLSRAVRGCASDSSKVSPSHDQLLERAVETCPVVEIKIGGVVASYLLDTGSQVSTQSEGFFWNNFGRKDGDMLSTSGWLKLTAANGLDIPYQGCLELVVETMGMTIPDCGF